MRKQFFFRETPRLPCLKNGFAQFPEQLRRRHRGPQLQCRWRSFSIGQAEHLRRSKIRSQFSTGGLELVVHGGDRQAGNLSDLPWKIAVEEMQNEITEALR